MKSAVPPLFRTPKTPSSLTHQHALFLTGNPGGTYCCSDPRLGEDNHSRRWLSAFTIPDSL